MTGEASVPLVGKEEEQPQRDFIVLDPAGNAGARFCGNGIVTAKYSFIPLSPHFLIWKNLFEQFHKAANVYFLLISALQLIPGLSPTGRYTTLGPLVLILMVTMAKDTYEDVKRHRSDADLNNSHTHAYRNGTWAKIAWKELKVGELCKVKRGQAFPADLVLVWSPEPEGMCYIETANLDGETNLKIRKSAGGLYKQYNPSQPDSAAGKIACETPNNRLYNFDGYYEKSGKSRVPLNADNILLRGACLRNTPEVVGIVVFTGADTKLMRNSSAKASKMSAVDHVTNRQILFVFLLLLLLCVGSTIGWVVSQASSSGHWYLGEDGVIQVTSFFAAFGTFLILFNNLIPISLYVTMEAVKLAQALLISSDIEMYHEETDTPASAKTSSLNEELGQVEYIFSDKTGTLTCNIMDFLKFTCHKYDSFQHKEAVVSYGAGTTEIGRAAAAREGRVIKDDRPADFSPKSGFYFYDPRIHNQGWLKEENAKELEFFFTFLAVCHAVVPEHNADGTIEYQAASPDEACLVKAARELGVEFFERSESHISIRVAGRVEKWDILNVIEFDSTRKRMSVICQDPKGRLLLLCKGADTVIYERLRQDPSKSHLHNDTLEMLTNFAAEGLRTLVLGKLELDQIAYGQWAQKYADASTSLVDRAKKMAAVAEEIEKNLELVGTTAIEDKLQMGVPATIELLATAGIKIWVLTGDKQETAINIGFACALLHNDMGLFMFDDCDASNVSQVLAAYLTDAKAVTNQDLGLVIQGNMLEIVLPTDDEKKEAATTRESELFLSLATRCKAVICCRVSPLQKATVVSLVKNNMKTVTLAIGDGANDVSMIQAAHVGIGISGLEGLQAARASDYSIAQFRYLMRLLLIHGRYNYRRISKLILYCFYKNIVLFLTQFWYTFMNRFTGQSLYDPWGLSLYNIWFTAYPIVVLAVLDKDVQMKRLLSKDQFPELYHDGMKCLTLNTTTFWKYTFNGILQSIVGFFICIYACEFLERPFEGQALGMDGTGIVTYTTMLYISTAKIALETQTWTVPYLVILILSAGMWYVFLGIYGNMYAWINVDSFTRWYGAPYYTLAHPLYWACAIVTAVTMLLRDFVWKAWRHNYMQKLNHIVQDFEGQNKNDSRRTFSRRDVVRCAPHLLPKFQSLNPYEPHRENTGVFFETEMQMPSLKAIGGTIGTMKSKYLQDEQKKSLEKVPRAPMTGSYFAQPGKVKIKDIVLDDL